MKVGIQAERSLIQVQFDKPIIIRRRAMLDFTSGCHGNRFYIILLLFQKYRNISETIIKQYNIGV